ncbi:MAG: biotin transporter BioY [Clostridiales bacterium]|nr:biotin transporter BioY [Clostridiales bacterium]
MIGKSKVFNTVIIGMAAAIICVLGPLSIPIGTVPITFTNLAIFFILYILGMKMGLISYFVYMLIGIAGLPVFSGFNGGIPSLMGRTGGYIIGFIPMALVAGYFIDRFFDNFYLCFLGMSLGMVFCYGLGTAWLAYQSHLPFGAALAIGVVPFIPGDILKIVMAGFFGPRSRRRLEKANIFSPRPL